MLLSYEDSTDSPVFCNFSIVAQLPSEELQRKPGKCPVVQNLDTIECPTPENLVTECLLDKDCNGSSKCCSDGCSMKCRAAELVPTAAPILGPKGERGQKGDPVSSLYMLILSVEQ